MEQITTASGTTVSYDRTGSGDPLLLVHGSFADHRTNWQLVEPLLAGDFTLVAVARRGRGSTSATHGHSVADEALDVVALMAAIDEPVLLLGHSYGAQVALAAAAERPDRVRRLVLYEPPWPHLVDAAKVDRLETRARSGDWDGVAGTFLATVLGLADAELAELRGTPLWPSFVADAEASMGDVRALAGYAFRAERFRDLTLPVLLQVGTASEPDHWVTDALAAVLPDVTLEPLPEQGHDAMLTAPELYARSVVRFLRA